MIRLAFFVVALLAAPLVWALKPAGVQNEDMAVAKPLIAITKVNNVARLDPVTAKYSYIGTIPGYLTIAQELTTIDDKNGILYTDKYFGVGDTCDFDPSTGDVLVSGKLTDLKHHIYRYNTRTRTLTPIVVIPYTDMIAGPSAFDWVNKIYWVEYGVENGTIVWFGIDVVNKVIKWELEDAYNLETLAFDPLTKQCWGLGIVFSPNTSRVILSLDASSGTFNIEHYLPGFFMLQAGFGSVDFTARRLYSILEPGSAEDNKPYSLVTVDLKSGVVLYQPTLTTNLIPWDFQVYNK